MNVEITERQRAYLTVALFIWREMLRREGCTEEIEQEIMELSKLIGDVK
jgi:hypothetical protein